MILRAMWMECGRSVCEPERVCESREIREGKELKHEQAASRHSLSKFYLWRDGRHAGCPRRDADRFKIGCRSRRWTGQHVEVAAQHKVAR